MKQNPQWLTDLKSPALRPFLTLWATQSLSHLGSSMTSFALVLWSYTQTGSALATALLSVSTYAPYVIFSIFAGALSDRWDKRKTMLACDTMAAACTLLTLLLLWRGSLQAWHLYLINALNGLMNTFQQPASEVAVSLLAPKEQYQRVSGLQSLSSSAASILTPIFATALFGLGGMEIVIGVDLATFLLAFLMLLIKIRIPQKPAPAAKPNVLSEMREGLAYLFHTPGILGLILFLAAINLIAMAFEAALPAMVIPRSGETALGMVSACTGLANVAGSLIAAAMHPPESRVKVIFWSLLLSMSTENLLLGIGRSLPIWCVGAVMGWLLIPIMNTNLNALYRTHVPVEYQGRFYAARNSLQFFTIPLGYLLGGWLTDNVFEPLMAAQLPGSFLCRLVGEGKGAGAALFLLILWPAGVLVCLIFGANRHIWNLEKNTEKENPHGSDQ